MKMQIIDLLEPLSKVELSDLTGEVKEILDHHPKKVMNTSFTAADLWNIHRNKKDFYRRRFL